MRDFRQKISDYVLRRAENKAHYKTRDLSIAGFDDNYQETSSSTVMYKCEAKINKINMLAQNHQTC